MRSLKSHRKPDRVEVLPDEVARVPVEAERLAVPDGLHRRDRRPVVERDLARVHLVGEAHADLVEHVEDRVPAVGEVLVAGCDRVRGDGREHRDVLPDARAREADDGLHAQLGGHPRSVLHLLGGALAHTLRVAVAPDRIGQDVAMPLVDRIVAHRLALEVVRDRPDLEPVRLEEVELALHVRVVVPAVGVEVITPARDLEAVVAPARGELDHLFEREVGPLAGEQGDGARHAGDPFEGSEVRLDAGPGGAVVRAALDRGERVLHLQSVGERRLGCGARGDRVDEVLGLV